VRFLDAGDDLKSKPSQAVDSDSKTNIASVTQAFLDIKFLFKVHLKSDEAQSRPLVCDLYCDSTSNNISIRNRCAVGIEICPKPDSRFDTDYYSEQLFPQQTKRLEPRTYGITIHKSRVLDLRVLASVGILDTTRKLVMPSAHCEVSLKRVLSVSKRDPNGSLNAPSRQIGKVDRALDNSSILNPVILSLSSLVGTGNPFIDILQHGVLEFWAWKATVSISARSSRRGLNPKSTSPNTVALAMARLW
jgi:hypothetical protein